MKVVFNCLFYHNKVKYKQGDIYSPCNKSEEDFFKSLPKELVTIQKENKKNDNSRV